MTGKSTASVSFSDLPAERASGKGKVEHVVKELLLRTKRFDFRDSHEDLAALSKTGARNGGDDDFGR